MYTQVFVLHLLHVNFTFLNFARVFEIRDFVIILKVNHVAYFFEENQSYQSVELATAI